VKSDVVICGAVEDVVKSDVVKSDVVISISKERWRMMTKEVCLYILFMYSADMKF